MLIGLCAPVRFQIAQVSPSGQEKFLHQFQAKRQPQSSYIFSSTEPGLVNHGYSLPFSLLWGLSG